MARILAVGIATLDVINLVATYPSEDSEVRALGQRVARGGNATNSLVVLSQLGHACSWAGLLAEDAAALPILADLRQHGIDLRYVRRVAGSNPSSQVLVSQETGSRSIVHYRDLPEMSAADFAVVTLEAFDWVHFEGRNVEATQVMLARLREQAPTLPCSLEVEKPRAGIDSLFAYADLLLSSRGYAESQGYSRADAWLRALHDRLPQADLVCSWGEEGAWAIGPDGQIAFSPAYKPAQVIDTLGAGDTFNAAIIDARLRGLGMEEALHSACRLAGSKCGQWGLAGLVKRYD